MKRKIYIVEAYNGASYEDAEYKNIKAFTHKRQALKWIDEHPLQDYYKKYFYYSGYSFGAKYIISELELIF